jgi:hypothetical protein
MAVAGRRKVLVHRRWRTVHELREDGTTLCGNGLGFTNPKAATRPGRTKPPADDYELLWSDELPPHARSCKVCKSHLGRKRRESS